MSRKIDGQRDLLAHHAEQHEHVGDHHRREQLEEVLDPQVDDPEAPELGDGEVVAGARDQADGVEGRDRAARRGRTATACCPRCSPAQPPAQDAPEHEHPHEQPDRQQHLPEPREVEVLEALQAEPVRRRVLEHAVDAEVGADQRAEHDDGQRAEQREGELALVLGLAPGDHRREEDPGRHERRRDPEERELDVPGAHQVVREDLREVEAEEARRSRRGSAARRRRRASGSGTAPPSRRRTTRIARCAGRERDVARARGTTASPARGRASRGAAPAPEGARTGARCRRAARSARARDQTITFAVGLLSTRGSGGQLFV